MTFPRLFVFNQNSSEERALAEFFSAKLQTLNELDELAAASVAADLERLGLPVNLNDYFARGRSDWLQLQYMCEYVEAALNSIIPGGNYLGAAIVSGPYNAHRGELVITDGTVVNLSVVLPDPRLALSRLAVVSVKMTGGLGPTDITAAGGQLIDGAATASLSAAEENLVFRCRQGFEAAAQVNTAGAAPGNSVTVRGTVFPYAAAPAGPLQWSTAAQLAAAINANILSVSAIVVGTRVIVGIRVPTDGYTRNNAAVLAEGYTVSAVVLVWLRVGGAALAPGGQLNTQGLGLGAQWNIV